MNEQGSSDLRTEVIGCRFSTFDLCFVRIETALISVAFESTEEVILYTRETTPTEKTSRIGRDLVKDKSLLKTLLGPLFREENFGLHRLRGGEFEVVIPEKKKAIIPPEPQVQFSPDDFEMEADSKFTHFGPFSEDS